MIDNEKVGRFIAKLRKEKNMTQDDLSLKLNVDRTIVSKWERGIYIPNAELLLKMQTFFDVTINEILYGERKNADNTEKIDSMPIDIINKTKKRIKKYSILLIITIICLIISFFIYYFINNYNSIKIYRISGESSKYAIKDGILIYSNEKSYIKLGNIYNNSNKKISNIKLFYKKNNKDHLIYSGRDDDSNKLIINVFGYNEMYKYSDIPIVINNLYLEIANEDNEKDVIKLKLVKDFSNNKITYNHIKPISDGEIIDSSNNVISKYIKDNLKYNNESNKYYNEYIIDDINYKEEYYPEMNTYILSRNYSNIIEKYEVNLDHNIIIYSFIENDNITDNYSYDYETDDCFYGKCNYNNLNSFIEKYLNNIIYNN